MGIYLQSLIYQLILNIIIKFAGACARRDNYAIKILHDSVFLQAAQARIDASKLAGAARDRKLAEANSLTNQAVLKSQNLSGTLTAQRAKILSDQQKALADIQDRIKAGMGAQSLKTMGEYKNVFNGFALNVSKAEAEALKQSPYVKAVYPNLELHTALMDSVPLINADDVWRMRDAAGNSLTGKGVTIAIIDTGVDYTRLDLGNCTSFPKPIGPKPPVMNYVLESPHPLPERGFYSATITKPANFSGFSIHFANLSGASMSIYGNTIASYGAMSDFWTRTFKSDYVNILLWGRGYGFYIDKISNGTIYSEGCQKVIGGYDFTNNDDDPMDDNGHGTAVASVAAANGALNGVAPDAKILAYKVCSSNGGSCISYNIIAAIENAVDPNNDGDFSDRADVISISIVGQCNKIGGYSNNCGPDDPMSRAVDRAVDAGVVAVIAAGNEGPGASTITSPGTARKAITAGASHKSDDGVAGFSSQGPVIRNNFGIVKPDVVAPGSMICVASLNRMETWDGRRCFDNWHWFESGTSFATPMVSGAAALVIQAHPDWTPQEVKMALRNTAKKMGYANIASPNKQGYGRIDALQAVSLKDAPPIAHMGTGGYFSGAVDLAGTATARSFSSYTVQYGTGNGTWYNIGTYYSPVIDGILARNWRTDAIKTTNTYFMRLIVNDTNGASSEDRSVIITNNINDTGMHNVTFSVSGLPANAIYGGVSGSWFLFVEDTVYPVRIGSNITLSVRDSWTYYYAPSMLTPGSPAGVRYGCTASCSGYVSSSSEIKASYQKQYQLTMSASSGTGGTVSPQTDWYDAGSSVQISASPSFGYTFSSWTGSGTGSYSGTSNPATVRMNAPVSEIANVNNPSIPLTFSTSGLPGGTKWSVNVNYKQYSATVPNSISVSGLNGNTRYSYDYVVLVGTSLYMCKSGCSGTASPGASVSASYRKLF